MITSVTNFPTWGTISEKKEFFLFIFGIILIWKPQSKQRTQKKEGEKKKRKSSPNIEERVQIQIKRQGGLHS